VSENLKQAEELRRKNAKLAVILGLVALGIYLGFILKYV
jgi:uncharacterized membrane protein (DUF485 family)